MAVWLRLYAEGAFDLVDAGLLGGADAFAAEAEEAAFLGRVGDLLGHGDEQRLEGGCFGAGLGVEDLRTSPSVSTLRWTTSAGLAPWKRAFRASRVAVRPSEVSSSVMTALASSLAPASALTPASAVPLAKASFSVPHRPLGSAAVTATPAIITLSITLVHSSGVKLCLLAMIFLRLRKPRAAVHGRCAEHVALWLLFREIASTDRAIVTERQLANALADTVEVEATAVHRKIDVLRLPDIGFAGHEANLVECPAVVRIATIVAKDEVAVRRHGNLGHRA